MLCQQVYCSTPIHQIGHISDLDILREALARNSKHGVTGFLLRGPKRFCQVLEGAAPDVADIFGLIRSDRRHTHLIEMPIRQITDRQFSGWTMGYATLRPKESAAISAMAENLEGGVDKLIDLVHEIAQRHG